MTQGQPTGSKQRKSRVPGGKPSKRKAVVEINERQIATGSMSTSGEAGADFIARVSDWLQANGKIVLGLIGALIIGFLVLMIVTNVKGGEESTFQSRLVLAAKADESKDVVKKFDALEEEAGKNKKYYADFWYQYSTTLAGTLEKDIQSDKPDDAHVKRFKEAVEGYKKAAEVEGADTAKELRSAEVTRASSRISQSLDFLNKKESRGYDETKFKRDVTAKIVKDGMVTLLFETTRGEVEVTLYDVDGLRNTINTIVTLVDKGYYQNCTPAFVKGPGIGQLDDQLFSGARLIGFGDRGRLKAPDKEGDDPAKLTEKERKKKAEPQPSQSPFFTIEPETLYGGSQYAHARGKVFQYFDPASPFKRGTQFAVDLTDNKQFNFKFQVIGEVTKGIENLEAMTRGDQVFNIYVTQKQEDKNNAGKSRDYTPRVIMFEGKQASSMPTLWIDQPAKAEPPRLTKPEKVKVVGAAEKPQVVISTKKGDVRIELEEDMCPNTVSNFIHLITQGNYKGSVFHRVEGVGANPEDGGARIVQGGRMAAKVKKAKELKDEAKEKKTKAEKASGKEKTDLNDAASKLESEASKLLEEFEWTIKNEAKDNANYRLRNVTGTIAMARQGDLNSAGCQFFVNLVDYPAWDKEESPYCVFGRVVENLWCLYDIRADDDILDAWVVQLRGKDGVANTYVPEVKYEKETAYTKAKDLVTK